MRNISGYILVLVTVFVVFQGIALAQDDLVGAPSAFEKSDSKSGESDKRVPIAEPKRKSKLKPGLPGSLLPVPGTFIGNEDNRIRYTGEPIYIIRPGDTLGNTLPRPGAPGR